MSGSKDNISSKQVFGKSYSTLGRRRKTSTTPLLDESSWDRYARLLFSATDSYLKTPPGSPEARNALLLLRERLWT